MSSVEILTSTRPVVVAPSLRRIAGTTTEDAEDAVERVDRASVLLQDPNFAKEDVALSMVKLEWIRVYLFVCLCVGVFVCSNCNSVGYENTTYNEVIA